ncbi:helix-turn-helix transcriptional regulator [Mycolicibacterium llatzerense]|uniref:helix-turn-helix transcriptional regulator n=1 Tax=Mycolicibacterium llatzerense TaxID=280871 RepID=UPI0021B654DD|nr:hypothetical protein [Mycolicibacterium llatzerense]MCT7371941.1 hypothetical protein [Mycolicibacterium llatzerense]
MERFLSVTDIADLMQVSVNTINGRIRAGTFPPPDAMIGSRYQGWKASTIDTLLPPHAHLAPDAEPYELAVGATALRRIAEEMSAYSYGWHSLASEFRRTDRFDAENRLYALATKLERSARLITVAAAWRARMITRAADGSPTGENHAKGSSGNHGDSATLEPLDVAGLGVVAALLPPLDLTVAAAADAYRRLADELEVVSARLAAACRDQPTRDKIRTEMHSIAALLRNLAESATTTDGSSINGPKAI